MDNPNICFDKTIFYTYLFLLGFFVCFTLYVYLYPKVNENSNQDLNLKQELMNEIQKVRAENSSASQQINPRFAGPDRPMDRHQIDSRFLDKIYNPLTPPENVIPQGGFYNRGYDGYQQFQQLGFITNDQGQFPVFGRYKDAGRSDRYEYYTINEGRNRIKIPFGVKGNAELYSDDPVKVPELPGQDFTFKKYENEGIRYNPNLI
jgi:hypothetical protein